MKKIIKTVSFKLSTFIFLLLLMLMFILYQYHRVIKLGPASVHVWRQTDCLSLAYSYYKETLNFFKPTVFNLGEYGNGEAVSEFPLLYYITGIIWRFLGVNEIVLRVINIFIMIIGLISLKKSVELLIKSAFWGIIIPLLFFTSPLIVAYTNNFLPDAPSLGFNLVGLYFFIKWILNNKKKELILSSIFFALAGLLKISALIAPISLLSARIIYISFIMKNTNELKITIPSMLLIIAIPIIWHLYAQNYTKNPELFLSFKDINSRTICRLNYNEIIKTLNNFNFLTLPMITNGIIKTIIAFSYIYLLWHWKKIDKFFLIATNLMLTGCLSYLIIFFRVFDVHDYYFIVVFIFPAFLSVAFLKEINIHHPSVISGNFSKFIALLILVFSVYYCEEKHKIRYFIHSSPIIDRAERELWKWYNYSNSISFGFFKGIDKYLDSLGISYEDKIICLPDVTPNGTLYFIKRKGWTAFNGIDNEEKFINKIKMGAKYLIIYKNQFHNPLKDYAFINKYIKEKVGQYAEGMVEIYKIGL